ncbi:hypothetical protein BG015_003156, partial [Linnemannia schmuckeri]
MPLSTYKAQNSQQQHERQQQLQEEAPPPPYTYTPTETGPAAAAAGAATQSRQLMSPSAMPGANVSGVPPREFSRQLQFPPMMPGGSGSANPVPHDGVAPPLPPRKTPRTPRAPQFRGTVGAPQLYGDGVVDMSGGEYDAVPDSYFARPTGPRAPQLDTQEEEPAQGKQQEPVAAGVGAGILEKDDIQSYYQPPVFSDKKGENPLQDVKQPILEQQQQQQQQEQSDPYYQSHQQSAPVVYRPPAAPQFSPQVDQHQQLHSISSVVNPVSSPAMGYAETPTIYHPPTTTYPPPTVAPSPTLSHYPPPSTPSMFSPAAVVRPLPA